MRIFDLIENVVMGVLVSAVLLALAYVAVEQVSYVGAKAITTVAPVLPPTYEEKVRYLAELRLKSDVHSVRSVEIIEAKMAAGQ